MDKIDERWCYWSNFGGRGKRRIEMDFFEVIRGLPCATTSMKHTVDSEDFNQAK